jgi:CubicO group peptidase (beta-lactamase class C family)
MQADTMFWIASMTKPVTSVAILMLQDDGKLSVDDPVSKYLPEFAALKTPSGKPANITIAQLLSHTSGLASPRKTAASRSAKTLRELAAIYLAHPMQFEPGSSWAYTTSGFVVAGLIVETVAGQPFDAFLQNRLFDPLGMKDTTFYPSDEQRLRLARGYRANPATGEFTVQQGSGRTDQIRGAGRLRPAGRRRPLLHRGRLLAILPDAPQWRHASRAGATSAPDAFRALTTVCTGDLPTGYSKRKMNHVLGWGLGVAIVRSRVDGVSAWLSPGSFGHPGAWGTAAWIDPAKGVAYVMMVQRSNMPDNFRESPGPGLHTRSPRARSPHRPIEPGP